MSNPLQKVKFYAIIAEISNGCEAVLGKGTLTGMNKLHKIVSLLMCVCMLLGATALAAETPAITEIAADAVVATINGEDITWGDAQINYDSLAAQYGSYYDLTQQDQVDMFRSIAMENMIVEKLLLQKATEFGFANLTAEQEAEIIASAEATWESGISYYITNAHPELTEEDAEGMAAARAEAEMYWNDVAGLTKEMIVNDARTSTILTALHSMMTQDAAVTDEEVEALYQSLVEADKALYENDLEAYTNYNIQVQMMETYAMMYGMASEMDYAWYRPEGFRYVRHILLPVDEALMTAYTDLQARYEEQQAAAEAAAEGETVEETAEPVTVEQVNQAKAAILASKADVIDEINQKIAEGVDFEELIATYGVDADGNPSDPGMANPDYANGYEVCAYSSNYVTEFTEAAMSIDEVGGVSAPYLSTFGIHIVKYMSDVPAGPIEMTDVQRQAKYDSLLESKRSELYSATLESWLAESEVTYTGVVPSMNELEAFAAE